MDTDTLDILESAKAVISDPDRWCVGAFAEADDGLPTEPYDPDAIRFCAIGATEFVAGDLWRDLALARLHIASDEIFGLPITEVNDKYGREAAIRCFDLAIYQEKKVLGLLDEEIETKEEHEQLQLSIA